MAAFIVISADNRLHYLVDGIEKCRPLNPDVSAEISTGKISKSDEGYVYEYTIHGKGCTSDKANSFSNLLSNQLAAFRLAYAIPQDEFVNIFFLENPLTEEDLYESESWLNEFEKVFHAGRGNDTGFCLFRVIFTYNHDNPSDVSSQIDVKALEKLLMNHKNAVSVNIGESAEPSFERYLLYIDNQKSDAAALCLEKDEHDLKMPRILVDFMMLVSNKFDKYKVVAAISPALVTTRCFSVGYAESMYYYPDVERYFIHADLRDIHNKFLTSPDEQSEEEGKKAMDVERYPFGLRSRKNRLSIIYEDVPFTDNIANHPSSADKKIDTSIVALRELLIKEREKEYDDFMNSAEVIGRKKSIEKYELEITLAQQGEDETPEEFDERKKQLCADKEKVSKELEQIIDSFKPECPIYTDRSLIYNELCVTEDEDKEKVLNDLSCHYNRLVNFAKSKKFYDFVKLIAENTSTTDATPNDSSATITSSGDELSNNSGCLFSRLLFWKKKEQKEVGISNAQSINNAMNEPESAQTAYYRITSIKEQLDLKQLFVRFKEEVSYVENMYKEEENYCLKFKLTTHTNHYFPLINRDELINKHAETSETRIQESINAWRSDDAESTKTRLIHIVKDKAAKHTKTNYSFIDWNQPFSFIQEISEENNMPSICNELQKRAAPIVNYNLTLETKENKVIRYFFSDRPKFEDEIKRIHSKLVNGNELSATMSTHIASKICMFQFLPMDEDVLNNLVDLQQMDGEEIDLVGLAEHWSNDSNVSNVNKDDNKNTSAPHMIDWGEH